jgi:hypothetical protein
VQGKRRANSRQKRVQRRCSRRTLVGGRAGWLAGEGRGGESSSPRGTGRVGKRMAMGLVLWVAQAEPLLGLILPSRGRLKAQSPPTCAHDHRRLVECPFCSLPRLPRLPVSSSALVCLPARPLALCNPRRAPPTAQPLNHSTAQPLPPRRPLPRRSPPTAVPRMPVVAAVPCLHRTPKPSPPRR